MVPDSLPNPAQNQKLLYVRPLPYDLSVASDQSSNHATPYPSLARSACFPLSHWNCKCIQLQIPLSVVPPLPLSKVVWNPVRFFPVNYRQQTLCFLYLPSSGFFASTGIFQLRPSRVTPKIFPSEHNIRTLLSEMPHFSAACFTVMYINLHLSSNSSIPYYRNNINSIGIIFSTYRNNTKVRKIPILNLPDHYYALLILVSSIVVKL